MSRYRLFLLSLLVLAAALPPSAAAAGRAYVHDRVLDELHDRGQVNVIVSLWDPDLPQARALQWQQRGPAIDDMVRRLLAAAPAFKVHRTYLTQPLVAGVIDQVALQQLLASPIVEEVFIDRVMRVVLNQSGPLVNQPAAQAAGYDGRNVAIAIIDTGIDYKHSTFGGTSSTTFPSAKVVGGYDFVNNDADPMDDNGHGTHVAGIAAGADSTYRGIAPAATLVAYKVMDASGYGLSSNIIAAVDRAIVDRDTYNIKAINLSLGDMTEYLDPVECNEAPDSEAFKDAVRNGILVAAAAGNESYLNGVIFPACISDVVAVGATYDQSFSGSVNQGSCLDNNPPVDTPVCFSNRGELIDLYAPGAEITSAKLGGGWVTYAGTSMATPHVAGAAACVVNMIGAGATPEAVRYRLKQTGIPIYDPATRVATPRIDLQRAITPPTTGPDLVVTDISTSVAAAFLDDAIPVTLSVKNQGNVASPASSVRVVFSRNAVISPQDYRADPIPVPALDPGATFTPAGLTVIVPPMPSGRYTIGAFADPGYAFTEIDETNNGRAGPTLSVGSAARVVSNTIPSRMLPGQTYSISITMANEGAIAWTTAAGFRLLATCPDGTTRWGASSVPLPSTTISPGAQAAFTFNVTAPAVGGWYPCHWRMAKGSTVFGEVATGATKILVADDPYYGQLFPAISANRVACEDGRGWNMPPWYIAGISVTNLDTKNMIMLPHAIPFPLTPGGWPEDPYTWMDLSYHWYPDISGDWVVWQTDDLPGDYWWYFQIVAYDLSRASVLPARVTYSVFDPWDAWLPAVDGNLVVWEDYRNDSNRLYGDGIADNSDLYIADLSAPLGASNTIPNYRICSAPGPQINPRISGNLVVWEDWRDGNQPDIYLYDLSVDTDKNGIPNWKESGSHRPSPDPAEKRLTPTSWAEQYPDIGGRTVIWMDFRSDLGQYTKVGIYALNLDTMVQTPLATTPWALRDQPRVDQGKVVWSDNRAGQWDVYWTDLGTGVTAPVGAAAAHETLAGVSGRRVAYAKQRNTYVWNIVTQTLFPHAAVAVQTFNDVNPDFWAFNWIEAVSTHGISSGYADGTYRPAVIVPRDQMAVYLARALVGGEANVPAGPPTPTFPDVLTNYWAYKHIEYCFAQDIVEGFPGGNYRPADPVNRGGMAVFVARAIAGGDANVPPGPPTPTFPDVTSTGAWAWAYKYVEYIAAEGVTTGYPGGLYHPEYACSRDQMAVYVSRAFHYVP